MSGRNYTDLIVWQKAMDFVEIIYHATAQFPREEIYGLTSQMRRAAVSIPSNIAESQGRQTSGEFSRFLSMAYGSLREVETQTYIARRLNYFDEETTSSIMALAGEIGRLINGLSSSLHRTHRGQDNP